MSFQLKKLNLELNTINDEVSEYRKDSGEREKASGEWKWVGGGEAYAKSKMASNCSRAFKTLRENYFFLRICTEPKYKLNMGKKK